jgi:hypothetical protein
MYTILRLHGFGYFLSASLINNSTLREPSKFLIIIDGQHDNKIHQRIFLEAVVNCIDSSSPF